MQKLQCWYTKISNTFDSLNMEEEHVKTSFNYQSLYIFPNLFCNITFQVHLLLTEKIVALNFQLENGSVLLDHLKILNKVTLFCGMNENGCRGVFLRPIHYHPPFPNYVLYNTILLFPNCCKTYFLYKITTLSLSQHKMSYVSLVSQGYLCKMLSYIRLV